MPEDNPGTLIHGKEPFVIMAKPVGPVCNLKCNYCYYLETAQLYTLPHQFRMPDDLLETFIRQYITASPGPEVLFVWHGGEPTLAGIDFYRRAVELQKQYLPEGWSCWNNLQTNGLLLDEEWCAFLADSHFDVGLSIDGTQRLHDAFRKDLTGNGTYEQVVAVVHRLQSRGIQPDLLCVVTAVAAEEPVGIYRALRDLNTGWIQFIPLVRRLPGGHISEETITGEAYGNFLSRVFDDWLYHDFGKINIQFFAEMMLVWSGGTASVCWMAPTCGRVLIVEHDGSVYSCDHFVNPEHRIGELGTSSLSELVNSPAQQRFGNDKRDKLPAVCRSCRWLEVCRGGCPKDRFALAVDGQPGLNYLCGGLRQFYAHAEKPLRKVVERMKQGLTSEAIRAELRKESLSRWKGIGRNDPCPCGSGRKAKNCCWFQRP